SRRRATPPRRLPVTPPHDEPARTLFPLRTGETVQFVGRSRRRTAPPPPARFPLRAGGGRAEDPRTPSLVAGERHSPNDHSARPLPRAATLDRARPAADPQGMARLRLRRPGRLLPSTGPGQIVA